MRFGRDSPEILSRYINKQILYKKYKNNQKE